MTRQRWIRIACSLAVVGGVAWILKVALIVENGGSNTDEGSVGLLYVIGLVLLLAGATSIGAIFRQKAPKPTYLASTLASALLLIASYLVLDSLARLILGDAGASYMEDEWGIIMTGVFWILLGGALLLMRPTPGEQSAPI